MENSFFLFKLFIDFYNMIHKNNNVLIFPLTRDGLEFPFGGLATSRVSALAGRLDRNAGTSGSVELVVWVPPPRC